MSDNTRPVADSPLADAWLVGGPADVPALRTRLAAQRPQVTLTVHDLTGVADESAWGELVREEVAAARADTGHARVLLGRLTEKRFLLVVVTAAPLPPAAVMRWLFTPGSPFRGRGPGTSRRPWRQSCRPPCGPAVRRRGSRRRCTSRPGRSPTGCGRPGCPPRRPWRPP